MKLYSKSRSLLHGVVRILTVTAAATLVAACSTLEKHTKQADSSLPIEVMHSSTGRVMSFRPFETSEKLLGAGSAKGHFASPAAHVGVQLIDASGQIVAEQQDDIARSSRATARGRLGVQSCAARFSLSEARQATRIRVISHSESHTTTNQG
jgi:hypothetical protein